MEQGSIAWDSSLTLKTVTSRVVLCGTEQYYMGKNNSHVGQSSIMWDSTVSCGIEQSHVVESNLMWGRAVSCGTEQYYVVQSSLMWDRAVTCGTEQSNVQQEQNGVSRDKAALCGTISLNISPAIVPEV